MNDNYGDHPSNKNKKNIESERLKNTASEETNVYRSKLSREIEKHKEKLLMLKFDEELLKKQLRDMFKD